jgi:large subunit ribosomal protein L22
MESKTYLKNLRVSPKKLRFFLPAIKKMNPSIAVDYLYYTQNKTAKILYKAIKSAITNAKNTLKVDGDLLEWKLLTIEQGQVLKRFKPGGRGTAKPIKKRFSHIKIIIKSKK